MSGPLNVNIALKDTDTTFPSVAAGSKVKCSIIGAEFEESKKTPGYWMLHIKLQTEEECNSTKGDSLKPGFKLNRRFGLQQSDHPDAPDFKIDLARLTEAAFGEKTDLSDESVQALVGKVVVAKIKKSKNDEFGETEVGQIIAAA